MALAGNAELLLLDEPAAGLSHSERQLLIALIGQLPRDLTLLFIEHDIDLALSLAETATVMHNGEVIVTGLANEIGASDAVRRVYLGAAK
jgi:branched-chain amino acid transport system ATP-binding protein